MGRENEKQHTHTFPLPQVGEYSNIITISFKDGGSCEIFVYIMLTFSRLNSSF